MRHHPDPVRTLRNTAIGLVVLPLAVSIALGILYLIVRFIHWAWYRPL